MVFLWVRAGLDLGTLCDRPGAALFLLWRARASLKALPIPPGLD